MSATPQLAALADQTRRSIFEILARRPQSVGSISEHLPVSRPAVSQHLRVLVDADLVTSRQEGARRIYSVRQEGLEQLDQWLDAMWESALDRFEAATRKEGTMTTTISSVAPVIKTRQLPVTPERAFRLFTEEIDTWWPLATHSIGADNEETLPVAIKFDGRIGGRVTEVAADGTEHTWAEVIAWQPPNRLVLAWHPSLEPKAASILEVRFAPAGDGTEMYLEHRGWEEFGDEATSYREGYDGGWEIVLSPFEAAAV